MKQIDVVKNFFKSKDYPFVLLFGSQSNGTASQMSDVDIGLFYDGEVDYIDLGYQSAMLESKLGIKIDMIALNDLYKKDPFLGFEILENHKVIALNDEDSYIAFKTSCQLYYLDHKPLIDMNAKALYKRIESDKIGERNFVTES